MLFNIYGDMGVYQLLAWVAVFVGLVLLNEIARRSKAGGVLFSSPQSKAASQADGGIHPRMFGFTADGGTGSMVLPDSSTSSV